MDTTYDFLDENESRAFWHSLLDQMGLDAFFARCSIKRITTDTVDFIRITVKAA